MTTRGAIGKLRKSGGTGRLCRGFPAPFNQVDHGWSKAFFCDILLGERDPKFSLLNYVRSQTELCRVLVRTASFPYLKRYAPLVLKNPRAEREGVAGYEVALNYNGVAFALMPRAESEIKGSGKFQLLSVNEQEYKAHPCRKLVVEHGGRWQLTDRGLREMELLVD